jgi:hypothetical protein
MSFYLYHLTNKFFVGLTEDDSVLDDHRRRHPLMFSY